MTPALPDAPAELEEEAPRPALEGTYFVVRLPTGDTEAPELTAELSHPLSGDQVELNAEVDVKVTAGFVRSLVSAQGCVALELSRRDEAGASIAIATLHVDLGPLLFGRGYSSSR